MAALGLALAVTFASAITPYTFDGDIEERFGNYELVFSGEVISTGSCTLEVEADEVWVGDIDRHDLIELRMPRSYRVPELEPGEDCLFLVDSTGTVRGFGWARDGCFIMAHRTYPAVLPEEDLDDLCRGAPLEINRHESRVTIHFPCSDETLRLRVEPGEGRTRVTSCDLPEWDGLVNIEGSIGNSSNTCPVRISLPGSDIWSSDVDVRLGADIEEYDDGEFRIDAFTATPCFRDQDGLEDFLRAEFIPIHVLDVSVQGCDPYELGLRDTCVLMFSGCDFRLRGRHRMVSSEEFGYWYPPSWTSLSFPTFRSGGSGGSGSEQRRFIRLDFSPTDGDPCASLPHHMLEATADGTLEGRLLYLDSLRAEPVEAGTVSLSQVSPRFSLRLHGLEDLPVPDLGDLVLTVSPGGRLVLGSPDWEVHEIAADLNVGYYDRGSVFFTSPDGLGGDALVLRFNDVVDESGSPGYMPEMSTAYGIMERMLIYRIADGRLGVTDTNTMLVNDERTQCYGDVTRLCGFTLSWLEY